MPTDFLISPHFPGLKLPNAKNFEANRLVSFRNWKNSNVFASALAKAGFWHTGTRDEVECCFCQLRYCDWLPGQKPMDIHKLHSPQCYLFSEVLSAVGPNIQVPSNKTSKHDDIAAIVKKYLSRQGASCCGVPDTGLEEGKDERVNAPRTIPGVNLRLERRRSARPAANSNVTLPETADGRPPYTASQSVTEEDTAGAYPQFSLEAKRHPTYLHFPKGKDALVERLCSQGFFYTGHQDIVICYFCGLGLYEWLAGDDPAIAHARWRPDCRHLHNVVSSAFIDAICREMANVGSAQ